MEIQRLGVVAPITVSHVAMKNTTCQGYSIPKVPHHSLLACFPLSLILFII